MTVPINETASELRALQLCALEILKCVHGICEKYDIAYSLCGGSVVGAHLYGGFLPWDDDIDLMLTRQNYNKLIDACQKDLPPYYRLINYQVSKEYPALFSKIVDTRTTLVQTFEDGSRHIGGVFLDFTCYDRIPHNAWRHMVKFLYLMSQWAMFASYCKPARGLKDQVKNIWLDVFGHHPSWLFKMAERFFTWAGKTKSYHYSELFGAFANTVAYPPSIFEYYATTEFEGAQYMIVRDYIEYLQTRYNRTDFREPEEKQVPPHYSYVNLHLPYAEYVNSEKGER